MTPRQIVLYSGMLMTLSAFSVDIMLPAFSVISQNLQADYSLVQMTIPVFIFALGVGQFIVGSLADRFGRKPVLKAGLLMFVTGAVICTLAQDIWQLLAGRALQGLGGAVGPVIGRAMIRDCFEGRELGRNMALASAVFAFGPIVAPLVGAGFMLIADWRILFVLMLAFGTILLLICQFRLPETVPGTNPDATRVSTFRSNIGTVFRDPSSRYFLVLSGIIMSMMMTILIAAPRLYVTNFDVSGTLFAVLFAAHGTGIIIGQIANRHFISSIGVLRMTVYASVSLAACCLLILAITLAGLMNAYVLSGLFILFATSYLIVYANAASLTMDPHGKIAGFTSSFYGSFSQVVSSVIAASLAIWIDGDLTWFSMTLLAIAIVVMLALLWWHSKTPATTQ